MCVCAGFGTLLDNAVLGITLPALRTALAADAVQTQWILASYSLTFGLALVPVGRLGDTLGRRRLFLAGLALFATATVIAALSDGPWPVVAARLVQGAAAGVISSQVLGIISDRYEGVARAKAFGAYGVAAGLSGVTGPLMAGAITVALTAVSGLYLAATRPSDGNPHAMTAALSVFLAMLLLALRCAIADHRRSVLRASREQR